MDQPFVRGLASSLRVSLTVFTTVSENSFAHCAALSYSAGTVTRTGVAPETWFGKGKRGPVTARLVVPLTSPGTGVAHVTPRAPHDG